MKLVLIGAGQRGMLYARYAYGAGHGITAVAEPDDVRREAAGAAFGIPEEARFRSAEELLSRPRMADAAIIATQDRDHFSQAVPAMRLGYDLLLEKPISPDPAETLAIDETARETGKRAVVCHVLRYTPFFRKIREILWQRRRSAALQTGTLSLQLIDENTLRIIRKIENGQDVFGDAADNETVVIDIRR